MDDCDAIEGRLELRVSFGAEKERIGSVNDRKNGNMPLSLGFSTVPPTYKLLILAMVQRDTELRRDLP